jgi:hypothetical protein
MLVDSDAAQMRTAAQASSEHSGVNVELSRPRREG